MPMSSRGSVVKVLYVEVGQNCSWAPDKSSFTRQHVQAIDSFRFRYTDIITVWVILVILCDQVNGQDAAEQVIKVDRSLAAAESGSVDDDLTADNCQPGLAESVCDPSVCNRTLLWKAEQKPSNTNQVCVHYFHVLSSFITVTEHLQCMNAVGNRNGIPSVKKIPLRTPTFSCKGPSLAWSGSKSGWVK